MAIDGFDFKGEGMQIWHHEQIWMDVSFMYCFHCLKSTPLFPPDDCLTTMCEDFPL